MITIGSLAQTVNSETVRPETYFGLSSDNKPATDVANGAAFIEMDTSSIYFYDAENTNWEKWGS